MTSSDHDVTKRQLSTLTRDRLSTRELLLQFVHQLSITARYKADKPRLYHARNREYTTTIADLQCKRSVV